MGDLLFLSMKYWLEKDEEGSHHGFVVERGAEREQWACVKRKELLTSTVSLELKHTLYLHLEDMSPSPIHDPIKPESQGCVRVCVLTDTYSWETAELRVKENTCLLAFVLRVRCVLNITNVCVLSDVEGDKQQYGRTIVKKGFFRW